MSERIWESLHGIRRHRVRVAVSLALGAAMLYVVHGLGQGDAMPACTLALYTLAAAATLSETLLPEAGGMSMTVLALIGGIAGWRSHTMGSPFSFYTVMPWSVAWAAGLLAYTMPLRWSVPCGMLIGASFALPWMGFIPQTGPLLPDSEYTMMAAASYALGYALRMTERARDREHLVATNERLRADLQRSNHLRANAEIQRRIHDSVAGELTYIMLATRPDRDGEPPVQAIHDHARSALRQVREAIILLAEESETADPVMTPRHADARGADSRNITSGRAPTIDTVNDRSAAIKTTRRSGRHIDGTDSRRPSKPRIWHERLHGYVTRRDRDLSDLGFHGRTELLIPDAAAVPGPDDPIPALDWTDLTAAATWGVTVRRLLDEIYANIIAHGDADGGRYDVRIEASDGEWRIRTTNDIPRPHAGGRRVDTGGMTGGIDGKNDETDRRVGLYGSGTGLERQRRTIASLGGAIDIYDDGGTFRLFCELPTDTDTGVKEHAEPTAGRGATPDMARE